MSHGDRRQAAFARGPWGSWGCVGRSVDAQMRTRADFQPHFGAVSPALRPPAITALARADMVTERR